MPAAVSERDVAVDLLEAGPAPRDLLADKGFSVNHARQNADAGPAAARTDTFHLPDR